jgi:hypothetical protein
MVVGAPVSPELYQDMSALLPPWVDITAVSEEFEDTEEKQDTEDNHPQTLYTLEKRA